MPANRVRSTSIVNRRQFARTSKTPGRTQLVNFFSLRDGQRLVDLPGYGFARVAESVRAALGPSCCRATSNERKSLGGLILVVDIRRQLTDFDRQMLALAESVEPARPRIADQGGQTQARPGVDGACCRSKKALEGQATVQLFSALNRQGVDEAREVLERCSVATKKTPGGRAGRGLRKRNRLGVTLLQSRLGR